MNDQTNQNGVDNTQLPVQPTPTNITPEVPEMPALAAAPEAAPTPVVVEEPAMPAPAPVVAPAEAPAPVVEAAPVAPAPVPEAPVVAPAPAPVMPEAPVAPAPVVPEVPAAPVVPEAQIAPEIPAQPVVAPAPVEVAPAPQMAPAAPVAPVPPMPAPMQPAYTAAPVVAPVKQKTNGLCIAAIIFAFLMPLIGLILGIAGMSSAKKKGQKGKGLGITAIILSLLMPVIYVVAFFFLLGGALVGAVNGGTEAATALQEGCASLDEYGDYESGYVTCEDYTCEYDDGTLTLSSSCNLINTDDYEEEEEEDEEPVTPAVTQITLPSTKWLFASDSSEIVFTETGFNWYKDENIYTDNYYTGTYKFYMGAEAAKYITEDLSSYGVTSDELQGLYSTVDGKSEANLVVLVLETTSMYIGGQLTDLAATPIVAPYYGFAIKDGETLDLANMKSATYATLNKKAE